MSVFRRILAAAVLTAFIAVIAGCGGSAGDLNTDTVRIIHMNDSHSFIEGQSSSVYIDGVKTSATLGGMAKAAALIDDLRTDNSLVLHAGDAVQGSLYYTLFDGEADADVLNTMGFDVMAIGNHEFDDGDEFLSDFIDMLDFPVISANVVPDAGNVLEGKFEPYVIETVNGREIGIIGLTIAGKTQDSSNPSDEITFLDETASLQQYVDELKAMGIGRIVVLSHYGYTQTQAMASQVTDIDVIVDGDSHTLLGDFDYLDLSSSGEYPTMTVNADGDRVCIVQAWEYSKVVGELDVMFDGDKVIECSGTPHLIINDDFEQDSAEVTADVRETIIEYLSDHANAAFMTDADEKAATAAVVADYSDQVDALTEEVIGQAGETLIHTRVPAHEYSGNTQALGSDIAPIVAKAFYDLSNRADICIQNAGGVRISVEAGDITYGTAYTLLPFSNTLYELEMYGSEIKQVLEDAVEGIVQGGSTGGFPYSYALRYDVDATQAYGSRFSNLEVKDRDTGIWSDIEDDTMYVVVTNSFTASGQDGYTTFATVQEERGPGVDTYLDYALSFVQYVQTLEAADTDVMKLPAEDHPVKSYISTPSAEDNL